jgi:hypothetical protein
MEIDERSLGGSSSNESLQEKGRLASTSQTIIHCKQGNVGPAVVSESDTAQGGALSDTWLRQSGIVHELHIPFQLPWIVKCTDRDAEANTLDEIACLACSGVVKVLDSPDLPVVAAKFVRQCCCCRYFNHRSRTSF